ncbi:hypothetical protein GYMLUDRAFT_495420 [Collybiopsis luxurians FD-317 M1]|uniref:Zinc finger PHD-type domain-containing protein n=1 Tax=Collybiopsis luxurians FD-317 M1 TaxID=944289 RepID=A0A0D0BEZ1_9AGAR|nr:hypothetical protein GYMLUDRAFT_495420 [Collybiopsis luxurians FD-317 M1]
MPRRASARTAAQNAASSQSEPSSIFAPPQSLPENLVVLRKQWKWAAFSQFFFTFSPMLSMDDITLKDVEDDLYLGSSLVISRVMVKLLYTLSYDRKVNLNNWQTTLRRQYKKRNPELNPIGSDPVQEAEDKRYRYQTVSPPPESTTAEGARAGDEAATADGTSTRERSESVQKDEKFNLKSEDGSVAPATRQQSPANVPDSDDSQQQETKDWLSLSMLEKLDSLHLLTEWQFQSPHRVRTLMKSDDDQASWRIEPIGYDAKRNAYWLIGADRLWIQRVPPKPPRSLAKNLLKRKRTTESKTSPTKRARTQATAKTRKANSKPAPSTPTASGRHGRAAKDQANLKLDAQAKELAELNRQAALSASTSASGRKSSARTQAAASPARASGSRTTRASTRPLGTRVSARLRGSEDDEEWQTIPDEWLRDRKDDDYKDGNSKSTRRAPSPSRSIANSSISELTELSEESDKKEEMDEKQSEKAEEQEEQEEQEEEAETEPAENSNAQQPSPPEQFVEWETIAVTLSEWEHVAERWQNATHYSEKALYKILTNHIVPIITEELREAEVKRQKEEAVTHRKRSSRLAIKESEKEEARLAARRKADEDERMSRARRLEARQQREEAERVKRETAREQRRKEREAREEQEAKEAEEKERKEKEKEKKEREKAERTAEKARQRASNKRGPSTSSSVSNGAVLLHHPSSGVSSVNGGSRSSRTPAGDDWELDCEICHRRGINLDDGVPLLCCGSCAKWQHIPCHDRADAQAGRPRRNWDQVEFICRQCRVNTNAMSSAGYNGIQMHYPQAAPTNMHPSLRAVHSTSSYRNHVPYGQGLGYDAPSRTNNGGYIEVPSINDGKGYGTSDMRSSIPLQTHMGYSHSMQQQQPPKQISFSHYQPQRHEFQHNRYEQHQYQSSSAYGQANQPYGNRGNSNNNVTGWNGYPPASSSYTSGSAERSSSVPESYPDQQAISRYSQQLQQPQQQWQARHSIPVSSAQALPQPNMSFATSSSFQNHHS